jgi:hypothetical protein
MNQEYTSRRLAVCFFGDGDSLPIIQEINQRVLDDPRLSVKYFGILPDIAKHKDIWVCSFQKRQYELDTGSDFDVCMAVDISVGANFKEWAEKIFDFIRTMEEKVYYVTGGFSHTFGTGINDCIFFAPSLIFDLACNAKMVTLPTGRHTSTKEQDFHFFLKTLKIKTECIYHENSDLFKWAK